MSAFRAALIAMLENQRLLLAALWHAPGTPPGVTLSAESGIGRTNEALARLTADGEAETPWVIWSEHHGWWGPNECGYTQSLAEAGRYSRIRAEEIERLANILSFHEIALPDPVVRFSIRDAAR